MTTQVLLFTGVASLQPRRQVLALDGQHLRARRTVDVNLKRFGFTGCINLSVMFNVKLRRMKILNHFESFRFVCVFLLLAILIIDFMSLQLAAMNSPLKRLGGAPSNSRRQLHDSDEVAVVDETAPPGTSVERMGNLEKQMGMVVKTLTTISSEMKVFQRAMTNMDVLIRSVCELQESSTSRSESRVLNTDPEQLEAHHSTSSVPSMSSGGLQPRRSEKGRSDSVTGVGTSTDASGFPSARDDLRISRLVRAAFETRSDFRVCDTEILNKLVC